MMNYITEHQGTLSFVAIWLILWLAAFIPALIVEKKWKREHPGELYHPSRRIFWVD
jgi:hypothetical protein